MKINAWHRPCCAVAAVLLLAGSCIAGGPLPGSFDSGGFFIGCNYWAKHAGMYMWSDWRPQLVERELAELEKHGVTVLRVFPLWSEFQPLTGDCHGGGSYRSYRFQDNKPLPNWAGVDDEMVRRFAWFCDCADRHGMRLIVGLVTGWMSGRQFVPSVFEEKDVLTHPDAVMWQTRFVKYFVKALKEKKSIVAWDLGNECECLGGKKTSELYNWMDHVSMAIRSVDGSRPVVSGMDGLSPSDSSQAPIRLNGELMDVLCTHPYSHYVEGGGMEPFNTMRDGLMPTAQTLLWGDIGGRPCFIEEIGNLGASCNSDSRTAAGVRTILFSAWANDLKGLLWWCNADHESLEFPPYAITPYERELGLLRNDYSPKPVMLEMRDFQKFRENLPFERLPARKTDVVIVVPEKSDSGGRNDGWLSAFGAYLLCRQAGIDPRFASAEGPLPESPFYIMCSASSLLSYTYPAQKRIFEKAKQGATVLVLHSSLSHLTHMREVTGLEVDYCTKSPCHREFTVSRHPEGKMTCDDTWTCRLTAHEAEVLGAAADGEPIFTRFRYGNGIVLLVNSPIDRATVERRDALTGPCIMPYYLIFREAMFIAGVKRTVEKGDCPYVGITEHPCGNDRTIVIAINFEPRRMVCPVRINDGELGCVWRGSVKKESMDLDANEAAAFEVIGRRKQKQMKETTDE